MIKFSIKPTKLEIDSVNNFDKFVCKVDYTIEASDTVNIVRSHHQAHLMLPEKSKFIPFEELTEQTVIEWIKNGLGAYYKTLCDKLNEQLEAKEETKIVNPPWLGV